MYALIAGWGGERRSAAARKFVLYTLVGSMLLLVGVLVVATAAGTTDIVTLTARHGSGLARGTQVLAFVLLVLAFAVKSPLWPLHTWLPDAHTAAPTIGSVLLAGVMLKMGTYGLLRIALPVVPAGFGPLALTLAGFAVAAIVVATLVCLVQTEIKRLIAYSSVGHMGFVLLGIATGNQVGLQAAAIGNIAHGVITGLLFFLVGAVKERYGTGELAQLGGLRLTSPRLSALLCFGAVASFGLPGLAGFWGEFFAIVGAWQHVHVWWRLLAAVAAIAAALTVAYFLRMLRVVVAEPEMGRPDAVVDCDVSGARPAPLAMGDSRHSGCRAREIVAWAPLVLLTLLLGVWPGWLLDLTAEPVQQIVQAVAL